MSTCMSPGCNSTTQILVGFYDPSLLAPLIVTWFIAAN